MKIGILSDTHGYLHPETYQFFKNCDEIWHAGDIMNASILDELQLIAPCVRAVYGNCDGWELRGTLPESLVFKCEKHKVMMMHIVGIPGKYQPAALQLIRAEHPTLLVAGHSHILKIMHDKTNRLLYLNPGAAGRFGFHTHLTMVRLQIDGNTLSHLEIYDEPKEKSSFAQIDE